MMPLRFSLRFTARLPLFCFSASFSSSAAFFYMRYARFRFAATLPILCLYATPLLLDAAMPRCHCCHARHYFSALVAAARAFSYALFCFAAAMLLYI